MGMSMSGSNSRSVTNSVKNDGFKDSKQSLNDDKASKNSSVSKSRQSEGSELKDSKMQSVQSKSIRKSSEIHVVDSPQDFNQKVKSIKDSQDLVV